MAQPRYIPVSLWWWTHSRAFSTFRARTRILPGSGVPLSALYRAEDIAVYWRLWNGFDLTFAFFCPLSTAIGFHWYFFSSETAALLVLP